jgi:hypothetical protein
MVDLSTKTKSRLNNVFLGLLILVAVGVLGWFFAVKPILAAQEKKRFEKAAASLQQLADEIQAKIGKADEVIESRSCGYSSAKFSKGNLSCAVRVELNYLGYDLSKSNRALTDVSGLIGSTLYPGAGNFDTSSFEDMAPAEQSFSQGFEKANLSCKAAYLYTDSTKFRTARPDETSGLVISLNCSGSSLAEHFAIDS